MNVELKKLKNQLSAQENRTKNAREKEGAK